MIETAAGPVELRDFVVSLALDGLTVAAIVNLVLLQTPVTARSVRQWLGEARKAGIAVRRFAHSDTVFVDGRHIGKRAYAVHLAIRERLRPSLISERLQALGAKTSTHDVRNWLWEARRDGAPILRFKGGRA